jgi:hypothetical protein
LVIPVSPFSRINRMSYRVLLIASEFAQFGIMRGPVYQHGR